MRVNDAKLAAARKIGIFERIWMNEPFQNPV